MPSKADDIEKVNSIGQMQDEMTSGQTQDETANGLMQDEKTSGQIMNKSAL